MYCQVWLNPRNVVAFRAWTISPAPSNVPTSLSGNCITPTNKPGLLIWHSGTLRFTGNYSFYGIVYVVNNSDGTCTNGFVAKSGGCPDGWVYETSGGAVAAKVAPGKTVNLTVYRNGQERTVTVEVGKQPRA